MQSKQSILNCIDRFQPLNEAVLNYGLNVSALVLSSPADGAHRAASRGAVNRQAVMPFAYIRTI